MQSLETLRKLGEVDREMIERRVRTLFELRAKGDLEGMLELLAPDIVCAWRGDWSLSLFPRPLVGKEAILHVYRLFNINYESLGSTFHEMLIDGDRVALHRTTTIRHRGTGQSHIFDVIDFMRFRDGLIVEFCEYPDRIAQEATDNLLI